MGHLVHAGIGLAVAELLVAIADARVLGKLKRAGLHPFCERVGLRGTVALSGLGPFVELGLRHFTRKNMG